MRLAIELGGVVRTVQVRREGGTFLVLLDGQAHVVDAAEIESGRWSLLAGTGRRSIEALVRAGRRGVWTVFLDGIAQPVQVHDPLRLLSRGTGAPGADADGPSRIIAPMPGKVVRILVSPGDPVTARQAVAVVEAMKMENELRSPRDGAVLEVFAREGASVEAGTALLTIG